MAYKFAQIAILLLHLGSMQTFKFTYWGVEKLKKFHIAEKQFFVQR